MERMLLLIFFSGLCLFIQSMSYQYVLIQELKTWDEAQAYCRQNYIDLATVQNAEDWTNVQNAVELLTLEAWIGLNNDINSWQWSYHNENITFTSWAYGEPNNYNTKEECGLMYWNQWGDFPCLWLFPFVCYNENGVNKFVYVSTWMTWYDAQSYCRQHYTDLATIQNQNDNDQVMQYTKIGSAWIGLYRDTWKWSYGTKANFSAVNWMTGQPHITGANNRPCGVIGPDGKIRDQLCSKALPFICLTYSKRQILKVEIQTGQNLNDAAVLQAIKQKLKDHGIEKDTRIAWRVQRDGNIFVHQNITEMLRRNQL